MKKISLKIASLIVVALIACAMLVVGVFALFDTTFTISGDVTYTAPEALAEGQSFTVGNFIYTVDDSEERIVIVQENPDNKPAEGVEAPTTITYEGVEYICVNIETNE